MKRLIFILFAFIFSLGLFAQEGSNIDARTIYLRNLMYSLRSGGVDSLLVYHPDSAGQYYYKNMANPVDSLDGVNLRTLTDSINSVEGGIGANEEFIEHSDTPNSYSGEAGKIITANQAEDALLFLDSINIASNISSSAGKLAIGTTIANSKKATIETTADTIGLYIANSYGAGAGGQAGIYSLSNGGGIGDIGIDGRATGSGLINVGLRGFASGASGTDYGVYSAGGNNYFEDTVLFNTIPAEPSDVDKFLVGSAGGEVRYRTGAQTLSDIGGLSGSLTEDYIPVADASGNLEDSEFRYDGTTSSLGNVAPQVNNEFTVSTSTLANGLTVSNNYGTGTIQAISGTSSSTSTITRGIAGYSTGVSTIRSQGVYGYAGNGTNNNYAGYFEAPLTTGINYGIWASGDDYGIFSGGGTNYLTDKLTLNTVNAEGVTATKVLTLDASGDVDYRTPAEIITDGGGGGGGIGGSGTAGYIPYFNPDGTTLDDSPLRTNGTQLSLSTAVDTDIRFKINNLSDPRSLDILNSDNTGDGSGNTYGVKLISNGAPSGINYGFHASVSDATGGGYAFYASSGKSYFDDPVGIGTTALSTINLYSSTSTLTTAFKALNSSSGVASIGASIQTNGGATTNTALSVSSSGATTDRGIVSSVTGTGNVNIALSLNASGASGTDYAIDIDAGLTNFVDAENHGINEINSDTNLDDTHYTILIDASSGNVTATLPDASGALVSGRVYIIKAIDITNTAKFVSAGGNIDGTAGATGITFSSQYESYTVQSDGTQWWIISKF